MNDIQDTLHRAHITLLLGGVRSGKSAKAVALAKRYETQAHEAAAPVDRTHSVVAPPLTSRVLFVATAQAFDNEMSTRITVHRRERPIHWDTLESPLDLAADLDHTLTIADERYPVIVIDCVTLWISNILESLTADEDAEAIVTEYVRQLLDVQGRAQQESGDRSTGAERPTHWIVVSNEVGLGIVPPTPLGRRYRDALGRANQLLANAADEVTLMVAGLEIPLKH